MRGRLLASLVVVGALGAGCNTAVGNYFTNRARDFGECFRLDVAAGLGLGGGVRAAGLVDVGLGGGIFSFPGIGWSYGRLQLRGPDLIGHLPWPLTGGAGGELFALVLHIQAGAEFAHEERTTARRSYAGLPALWTYARTLALDDWIWSDPGEATPGRERIRRRRRWARVHAFDVEATAFAAVVGVSVGFSPGEFVDFLGGWFGLDLAGDDRASPPPPDR